MESECGLFVDYVDPLASPGRLAPYPPRTSPPPQAWGGIRANCGELPSASQEAVGSSKASVALVGTSVPPTPHHTTPHHTTVRAAPATSSDLPREKGRGQATWAGTEWARRTSVQTLGACDWGDELGGGIPDPCVRKLLLVFDPEVLAPFPQILLRGITESCDGLRIRACLIGHHPSCLVGDQSACHAPKGPIDSGNDPRDDPEPC